ncbi:MAG: extracellular solute-binding protein [Candidatus Sungbacteria bacterium]|uniref:Extracellular solute-binding protein n=1 Tax=Candidatus Sungiibacteriota bacterium TaxID=2750080 RepID=A0A932YWG5_9BACT|nr:extracellular solute-binding protein [Candidatus Sungbacteria bacterium]
MNRPQLIIFGIISLLVLLAILLLTGVLPGLKERPPAPFTLTIWGTSNMDEFWRATEITYQSNEVPGATIEYVKKDPETYQREFLNVLAAGRGPDVFFLTDSALGEHLDKIKPLPSGSLGYRQRDLKSTFADGVNAIITDETGALRGIPLYLDTLALFFNRDYLNAANIPTPPETWDELVEQVGKLTNLSTVGGIQRSGIALGTAANVDHAGDILAALIYQAGGSLTPDMTGGDFSGPATLSALNFYTAFAASTKKTYTWNSFFAPSLQAFAAGETAMAIGYAADIQAVAAQNPQLNFDVAPLPQASGAKTPVAFGRTELAVVSHTSGNEDQAWRFLLWLSSRDIQKSFIDAAGLPPARRDLVREKPPRDYLAPFYDQVLSARLRPLAAGSLESILADMIEAVASRRFSADQAVNRAKQEIKTILPEQKRE